MPVTFYKHSKGPMPSESNMSLLWNDNEVDEGSIKEGPSTTQPKGEKGKDKTREVIDPKSKGVIESECTTEVKPKIRASKTLLTSATLSTNEPNVEKEPNKPIASKYKGRDSDAEGDVLAETTTPKTSAKGKSPKKSLVFDNNTKNKCEKQSTQQPIKNSKPSLSKDKTAIKMNAKDSKQNSLSDDNVQRPPRSKVSSIGKSPENCKDNNVIAAETPKDDSPTPMTKRSISSGSKATDTILTTLEKESTQGTIQAEPNKPKYKIKDDEVESKIDKNKNKKEEKERDTEGRPSLRARSPSKHNEITDEITASRSSSILGEKRASSKSVSRKVDYGKRALSSSEGEEKETSEDESKSDKDNEGEKAEPKSRIKTEEKSTLKKRRKESALPLDLKDSKLTSTLPSKDNGDADRSEQQPENRKKSKAGAKRKPADLCSGLLSQDLEDIKRLKQGDIESDDESSDVIGPQSDQSDTEDEDERAQDSNSVGIQADQPLSSNNAIRFGSSINEDQCSPSEQQDIRLDDLQTRQVNSSNLYSLSTLSAESECNILPLSCPVEEHNKWQEHEDRHPEVGVKKEFDDLVKLRADQKKSMQRAKDLLKAAFSESESETEESEGEDENKQESEELRNLIDVVDSDMT